MLTDIFKTFSNFIYQGGPVVLILLFISIYFVCMCQSFHRSIESVFYFVFVSYACMLMCHCVITQEKDVQPQWVRRSQEPHDSTFRSISSLTCLQLLFTGVIWLFSCSLAAASFVASLKLFVVCFGCFFTVPLLFKDHFIFWGYWF